MGDCPLGVTAVVGVDGPKPVVGDEVVGAVAEGRGELDDRFFNLAAAVREEPEVRVCFTVGPSDAKR